jgi:hydroxylamine reductase
MFCYQCEQTAQGTGCTKFGVCGKSPETAIAQDVLFHVAKGVGQYAHAARQAGAATPAADKFVVEALFTTVTNVNFDVATIAALAVKGAAVKAETKKVAEAAGADVAALAGPATFVPAADVPELIAQGTAISLQGRLESFGADVAGLQELITYGLKGMAAYADHARVLGVEDDSVYAFTHEALAFLAGNPSDVDALVGMALKVGEVNLTVMGLLDQANTGAYGHPEPTQARITPVKGKAILVSGHDLKEYPHLVGNYGGAWQDQRKEFEAFPGSILMTTNCIQKPAEAYEARIFTSGLVQWPGVTHIDNGDFAPVIDAALAAPGFAEDAPEQSITIGFARNAVLNVAGPVIDAVKAGKIRHFFLIGGCDGAKSGRNYYTDLAQAVPEDCVILTLACGKYRFNKLDFGDIGGIPRLLDCGQCNDAYSAIQIAVALAGAFECGVNNLPLSLILSWYEQKAVCILLTLLHLGIQDMRLGPSLPAFVGPNVLNVLVDTFGLKPISTPEEDLKAILG